MRTRPPLPATALVAGIASALAVSGLVVAGPTAGAAEPGTSGLSVPAQPGASSSSWRGSVAPGAAYAVADCSPVALADVHTVEVQVGEDAYATVEAVFRFSVTWADTAQDLALSVIAPDGSVVGSSDGGTTTETVQAVDLSPGNYEVRVCAFLATADTPYDATASVTTTLVGPPPPPPAPSCEETQPAPPAPENSLNLGAPLPPDPDPLTSGTATREAIALDHVSWSFTEGLRSGVMTVPSLPQPNGLGGVKRPKKPRLWDRVELVFENQQPGDPFDRVFGVAVDGVELLRGTTPRVDFQLLKDVTEVRSLFVPGTQVTVTALNGTYIGSQITTVRFRFYDSTADLTLTTPAKTVLPVVTFGSLVGNACRVGTTMHFPAKAPGTASIDVFASGHGSEEFWYAPGVNSNTEPDPRVFHVLVDGVEVGKVVGMPYVYALAGFDTTSPLSATHEPTWWTAQYVLDRAGLHSGTGEIAGYRIDVPPALLGLLKGERYVEIVQENGGYGTGRWITSARVLLG